MIVAIILKAISVLLIILFLGFALLAVKDLRMARTVATWTPVKGKVVESDKGARFSYEYRVGWGTYTSEYVDYDDYLSDCYFKRRQARKAGTPADAVACPGGRLSLGVLHTYISPYLAAKYPDAGDTPRQLFAVKDRATEIAERFALRDDITVYHHPEHPEIAVLDVESFFAVRFFYYVGIVLGVIALVNFVPRLFGFETPDWALPALFYVAVMVFLYRGMVNSTRPGELAEASMSWSSTQGEVIASYVKPGYKTGKVPVVSYQYEVGRKRYATRGIFFGNDSMSQQAAEQYVQRYPEGTKVEVYYDPGNPGMAVLEQGRCVACSSTGRRVLFWAFTIPGIVMLVYALGWIWFRMAR